MKKTILLKALLAALCLLLILPGGMAETRQGVISLEGMEEPIEETLFESPAGFSFWYASERLEVQPGEAEGIEGAVVKAIYSDDFMELSVISEAEAEEYLREYGAALPEPSDGAPAQVELYLALEEGQYHFRTLIAEGGQYLLAEGWYAQEAAEGNAKYFQKALDSAAFASAPAPEEAFTLRFRDESGSGSAYLRLDCYLGEEQQGMYLACPDPGKDFIELFVGQDDLYCYESPEDLAAFRLECSLGYAGPDTTPEDAILHAYSGEYVDQKWIASLAFTPEFGRVYECRIEKDASAESGFAILLQADGEAVPVR